MTVNFSDIFNGLRINWGGRDGVGRYTKRSQEIKFSVIWKLFQKKSFASLHHFSFSNLWKPIDVRVLASYKRAKNNSYIVKLVRIPILDLKIMVNQNVPTYRCYGNVRVTSSLASFASFRTPVCRIWWRHDALFYLVFAKCVYFVIFS